MVLSHAAGLNEILLEKLAEFGLTAQRVDYDKALLPQIKDADVLVNELNNINSLIHNPG